MPIIIILLALHAPPTARWDGNGAAILTWHQQSRACLWAGATFVGCYTGGGVKRVSLGGPQTDGRVRPGARTVYKLVVDGTTYDVPLRSVTYLPVFR
jgi:hypothetical protein